MRSDAVLGGLPAETALLVACARARLDPITAARVRELSQAVRDWSTVLELGRRHRMIPLLHLHLGAAADDSMPPTVRATLREEFSANAARNLTLSLELLAVADLLLSNGIRALPYKGPTLAQCVYGSLAARQMKDLDILLQPADVDRAVSLLETRDYTAVTRVLPGARRLGLEYQRVLARDDETIVELHWSVVPRSMAPAVALDDLWANRLHTAILGKALPSPSHEDMLVVLCIHGSKHRWARLEWICGVAEMLRSKPLDWTRVLERSRQWHASRMLGAGLVLARRLLDAPVPGSVIAAVERDRRIAALATEALDELFVDDDSADAQYKLRAFQLGSQERVRDKARYIWFRPLIDGARTGARVADWLQR